MASPVKIAAGSAGALALAAVGAGAVATRRWAKAADPTGGEPLVVPQGEDFTVTTPDGASLSGLVAGDDRGPTVVLSHCWTGDHRVWGPVARRLVDDGHRVVLYDQRGHGASSVGDDGLLIEALADDLRAVVEHVDADDAVVAGHSMGGMATQAFAIRHRDALAERVRGIALVATSSGELSQGRLRNRIAHQVLGSALTTRVLNRRKLGPILVRGSVGRQVALSHLEAVRDTFAATDAATRAGFFAAIAEMDLSPDLSSVDVPAVVVVGTRDTLTPVAHARRLAELLPDARLEVIPDAGHMLPCEQPDRVAALIAELAAAAPVETEVRASAVQEPAEPDRQPARGLRRGR